MIIRKLFKCDVLFYRRDEDVRIPELLRSISTRIQKGEGMTHPIAASILTFSALFDQLLWRIFRILKFENTARRRRLDIFSSWSEIKKNIDIAAPLFLSPRRNFQTQFDDVNLRLKEAFGVDSDNENRKMPWKDLFEKLRNRFVHRSIYLLNKDFEQLRNAFRQESPQFGSRIYTCFLQGSPKISTKEQEYECQFQLYRMLLVKKLRKLMEVFTVFSETYPQPLPEDQNEIHGWNIEIFDQVMAVYYDENDPVDESIVTYIQYQMDLEEFIAKRFLGSYTEDVISRPYSPSTQLGVPSDHPFAFYSITYTGYLFLQMCVLTIASSFDQIMWCLIQDKNISYFGQIDTDVIANVDVLELLGCDADGSILPWKQLLGKLRDRFVHRGTFLLLEDFGTMVEIVGAQEKSEEALIFEYLKILYENMKDFMQFIVRSMEHTTVTIIVIALIATAQCSYILFLAAMV